MVGEAHSYDNYRKMTEEDIAPYLIPDLETDEDVFHEKVQKKKKNKHIDEETFSALIITEPREFTHHIHVDYNPATGFVGLPESWKEILDKAVNKGEITIEEVMNNKEDAARVAGVRIIYYQNHFDHICKNYTHNNF